MSDDPVLHPHTGTWRYHDDDCRCGWYRSHCNRDGGVWSCCGACKQHSDCSGAALHPTHWQHPDHHRTVTGHRDHRPVHRPNAELRARFPGLWADAAAATPADADRPG